MTTDSAHFRLRAARIVAGFRTPKEFSRTHGIPQPTYHHHEAAGRGLTAEVAAKYAILLNVTPGWLLFGDVGGMDPLLLAKLSSASDTMGRPDRPYDDSVRSISALAGRVQQRLAELNTNIHAVAVKAGKDKDGFRNIMRGKSLNPQMDTLEELARALDWTVADLLGPNPGRSGKADETSPSLADLALQIVMDAESLWEPDDARVLKRARLIVSNLIEAGCITMPE